MALALGLLLLGVVFGGLWYFRTQPQTEPKVTPGNETSPAQVGLSPSTLTVLHDLKAPVELRFYCSLTPAGADSGLPAFGQRVTRLLSEYEQAGEGMIQVIQQDPVTNADAQTSAKADGITPSMLNAGGVCYLGLAVVQGNRTERLPQLDPAWEPALESDISRAIARVTKIPVQPRQSEEQVQAAAAAQREVEGIIPNLASVSVEEGTQILRDAYLQDFLATLKTTQPEIDALQQRMQQLQDQMSDADRESFLEQLQQLRARQKKQLDELAARVEAQVAALEQIKGVSKQPAATSSPTPTRPTR